MPGELLKNIVIPDDLKKLEISQLPQLSQELRQYIIDIVSSNPGHFGASLGVVELTVVLHYVFNTPYDRIIWDVGHQAYGHKILTGRREVFHTNRKYKGISGFPKISESEYDAFGVGHSSTSISAALGMAAAAAFKKETDRKIVAVIGDGSMTAGLAFEGLNNAGSQKNNLLVILNDNNMAIDPNVGALKEYLLDITTSKTYNKIKNDVWHLLGHLNKLGQNYQKLAQQIENSVKSFLLHQSNLFESLNFRYFGPVDGHDVVYLTSILNDLKDIPGPKLLHVITQKGKGFKQAEKEQTIWHAPGVFDKNTGEILSINSEKHCAPRYQDVFGLTLVDLAKQNDKIVGITPAMSTGCSLTYMMKEMPDRAFDVGIAEQHAVTFAAGLAVEGMIPFCNIYSTFLQRAYDQVIHDVALQNLNVVFCLDRGGLVGEDGATHHGVFDLAYMRCIPNMIIASPINEEELRNLMYTSQLKAHGPFTIRYPRGRGVMTDWMKPFKEIEIGKGQQIRKGTDIAILSIGHVGNFVMEASDKLAKKHIDVAHYDMRFVKPIDTEILHEVGRKFKNIITIEDGTVVGGFGSAVLEFMNQHEYYSKIKMMGVPDRFIEQGTPQELYTECGFDADSIVEEVVRLLHNNLLSNTA
ncbi:MAG: 1-deoxy-D-xylulose-5-phosphate synthase [Bacteroidales bacterium]